MILVLAVFMILNTFLMNVQERRKQLAVLRTLGATRRQVIGMLLGEGLVTGIAGTLLGSAVGVGGAQLLAAAMTRVYSAQMPPMHLTVWPFLLAAVLGCGVSLVAAGIPAWMASRVSPLEGLRPVIVEDDAPLPVGFVVAGFASFAVSGLMLGACFVHRMPPGLSIVAGIAFTVAFILLIPAAVVPASRLVAAALRPILGAEGRLAQRQLVRRRGRAALTIGLLYIAVSSGIGLGTAILSNVEDIRDWQRQTFIGDFFVRAMYPDLATGQAAEMPESLGRELAAIEGVTEVGSVRFVSANAADQPVVVVLREFAAQDQLPLDLKGVDSEEIRRRLIDGEVVVGSVLAKAAKVGVGDSITLETRDGPKQLRVAATTTEYLVGGLVVHMERSLGKRLFAVEGADAFMVKAEARALAQVEPRLKAICDERGLMLHSFADLRRRLDGLMNGVVGSLWGLLGLGYVVAGFAIANTLTMNVLEQTRDLALLRVIAMTRRQTRKTVLSQAVLIGVIGLAAGIVGGLAGAYVINLAMATALGRAVEFTLQPMLMAGTFLFGLAIVLIAAWIPALRASRLDLLIALHYE
jgi:putative ABC transport system permease protein